MIIRASRCHVPACYTVRASEAAPRTTAYAEVRRPTTTSQITELPRRHLDTVLPHRWHEERAAANCAERMQPLPHSVNTRSNTVRIELAPELCETLMNVTMAEPEHSSCLPQRAEVRTETPARVEIRGGGGAEVLVDGTSIGTVPAGQRSYRLNAPSGVHRLTVRKGGAVVHDSTVFFNDGTTKVIKVGR